jgi:hypothetical protein
LRENEVMKYRVKLEREQDVPYVIKKETPYAKAPGNSDTVFARLAATMLALITLCVPAGAKRPSPSLVRVVSRQSIAIKTLRDSNCVRSCAAFYLQL